MQQLLAKDLGWGSVVKALSGGVVVEGDEGIEVLLGQGCEICLSGQETAHSADGVLDGALLPWAMGIAKEGFEIEGAQPEMVGELGSVVEGDGLAQGRRQGCHDGFDGVGDEGSGFIGWPLADEQAGRSLEQGEDVLVIGGELHEVGLPMSEDLAEFCLLGSFVNGNTALNEACATAALVPAPAAPGLGAGQVMAPGEVVVAGDLGLDEAVDGLVADDLSAGLAGQSA